MKAIAYCDSLQQFTPHDTTCQPGVCNTPGSMCHIHRALIRSVRHTDHVLLCNKECMLAMQIMMMLTRDQARPEIPDISTLPGPHWSGIEGFVDLIKVTSMGTFVMTYNHLDHAYPRLAPRWLPWHIAQVLTLLPLRRP